MPCLFSLSFDGPMGLWAEGGRKKEVCWAALLRPNQSHLLWASETLDLVYLVSLKSILFLCLIFLKFPGKSLHLYFELGRKKCFFLLKGISVYMHLPFGGVGARGTAMTKGSKVESSVIDSCETVQAGVLDFITELHCSGTVQRYGLQSFFVLLK